MSFLTNDRICDKCGEPIGNPKFKSVEIDIPYVEMKHLCEKCIPKLKEWLKKGVPNEWKR